MSKRGFSETVLQVFLCGYAETLANGRTPSARKLAERLGYSETSGLYARAECISRGWLEVVQHPHGNSPGILRLTHAGVEAVGGGNQPTRKPVSRAASVMQREAATETKVRKCLCCGSHFASEGPGNRICARCRTTEAYCSGDATVYRAMLP